MLPTTTENLTVTLISSRLRWQFLKVVSLRRDRQSEAKIEGWMSDAMKAESVGIAACVLHPVVCSVAFIFVGKKHAL